MNNEVFLCLNDNDLNLTILNDEEDKEIFSKNFKFHIIPLDINNLEINLETILKELIIEVEKNLEGSFNDLNLLIETSHILAIDTSIKKNIDQKKISKNQIEFLIQDLKQQVSASNKNHLVSHIIIENYNLDDKYYENLPLNIKCNNLILQVKFICLERNFVDLLKKIFFKYQIDIKKIISTSYVKTMIDEKNNSLSKVGLKVINGLNPKEVFINPKKTVKMGFFERIFHIFS